jgi:hypothetical protein
MVEYEVMPKKKQKATPSNQPCNIKGCGQPGEHKAPKSRDKLHDYEWLCIDHVRERNQKWDFFAGMNRDEIEEFMRDAVTGHRPTWSREAQSARAWDALHEALDDFMDPKSTSRRKYDRATAKLSERVRMALAELNLDYPYEMNTLKAVYRSLVKQFHPDANKGSREAEEKFKQVTAAYLVLAEHLKSQ